MKILYVALSMRGMDDIIDGGSDDRGLPSFVYPLKAFIKKGHEVKIILISSYRKPINIKVDWLKNEDILYNSNADITSGSYIKRSITKFKESILLCREISLQLKNGKYDFVYCHGKAAIIGNIFANIYRIPCGYRIYGTIDMYDMLKTKGVLYTILKYPSYFALFNLKKKFMLITDDGSHGEYVVRRLRLRNSYKIYYWKNGVDRVQIDSSGIDVSQKPYIFTAGRVCETKGQHKSIEVLKGLIKNGCNINLLIAGPLVDLDYYKKLKKMIRDYNIKDYVQFLGDLPREQMQAYAHESKAVLLFARSSNLSNVFIECGIIGSVIITYDEESLHEFICNKKNGFFVSDHMEAVEIIKSLLSEEEKYSFLSSGIKSIMTEKMLTWNERCDKEVKLVQEYATRG